MPASIRIIKIVKDPMTREEAYTVEFECEVDESKELISELAKSQMGQKVLGFLERAEFIPEPKTEDMIEQAKREEEEIQKYQAELKEKIRKEIMKEYDGKTAEELKDVGREEVRKKYIAFLQISQGRHAKRPPCFGSYHKKMVEIRKGGSGWGLQGMKEMIELNKKCGKCEMRKACQRVK